MTNKVSYYEWFKKIMSIIMDCFFYAAPLASLYVFTSFLNGIIRYLVFILGMAVYFLIIYFFRSGIKKLIKRIVEVLKSTDEKKLFLIILFTLLLMKVVFSLLFNYDATSEGDVKIYNDIADTIIQTGDIHSDAISHLYGVALHFVIFKLLGIPLHVGVFAIFLIGTMVNYISFTKIIGKEKAFLAIMLYSLMPSSSLISFCPTHEIFAYMYISIFFFLFNSMIAEVSIKKIVIYVIGIVFCAALASFVNPGGYILSIIMILSILLSNIPSKKKIIIAACLILSLLLSKEITSFLNVNEDITTINTYTILIHGTNPESLGEQVDGYPLAKMREYIKQFDDMHFHNNKDYITAAKVVFTRQCLYLLKHPLTLLRLIIHKFYILWSGVHYPIEFANHYNALQGILYYLFLGVNTLIYLFVFTVGNVYRDKNMEDEIFISNYKLELLGVIALTMMCIVANKYSIYVTAFIYLVSFYRMNLRGEHEQNG